MVFNDEEICAGTVNGADTCETDLTPGGIVGFGLGYIQKSC